MMFCYLSAIFLGPNLNHHYCADFMRPHADLFLLKTTLKVLIIKHFKISRCGFVTSMRMFPYLPEYLIFVNVFINNSGKAFSKRVPGIKNNIDLKLFMI